MKELTLAATVENIPEATAFVDAFLEELDCPMKAQMQIDVALDELMSNVAYYAYAPGTGDVTLRLDYHGESRMVEITFIDGGAAYNPLEKEDPDVSLSAEKRGIGGLGIFLVRKTMDAMEYRREDGRNVLTIRKGI